MSRIAIKVQAAILLVIIIFASVGVYYFISNQWPITASIVIPAQTSTHTSSAQPMVQNDSNWAGYIIASDLQNPQPTVTSVKASWFVPEITHFTNDSFSAVWIGIGGFFDETLIQAGSEQDSINGEAVYSVWFELLPADAVTIDRINVSPGDKITASISLVNPDLDVWSIYLADSNDTQAFQNNFSYASSQTSAEWIVERPVTNQNISILANISTVTFTDCQATIKNQTGFISSFPSVQSIMYQELRGTAGITQLTYVSNLSNDGSIFTVNIYTSIPELPYWMVIPLLIGTFFAVIAVKKYHRRNRT